MGSAATRTGSARAETERVIRRYTAELEPIIGPDRDIGAPDMATSEREMAWIMDTYSQGHGQSVPAIVTGKPEALGGSAGRRDATGPRRGLLPRGDPRPPRLGARRPPRRRSRASARSARCVARELTRARRPHRRDHRRRGRRQSNEAGLDLEALGRVGGRAPVPPRLPGRRARSAAATLLDGALRHPRPGGARAPDHGRERCRSSNMSWSSRPPTGRPPPRRTPSSPSAASRWSRIVLANGGGVTVSYYEWAQDIQREAWTADAPGRTPRGARCEDAVERVLAAAERWGVDWRTAAQAVGIESRRRRPRAAGRCTHERQIPANPSTGTQSTYHRVADPQEEWGREVLARLELRGDETVLDAGCGSGRVTACSRAAPRRPRDRRRRRAVDDRAGSRDARRRRAGRAAGRRPARPRPRP